MWYSIMHKRSLSKWEAYISNESSSDMDSLMPENSPHIFVVATIESFFGIIEHRTE